MSANFYAHGEFNAICDRCGFKCKSSRIRTEWTGLKVCIDRCWERRNQQDLIRAVTDKQSLSWARPEGEDRFQGVGDITAADL